MQEVIMKIKNYTINEPFPMPSFYNRVLKENSFCILDIETTGLSSKYHNIILIGILYPSNNQIVVKQFFAENPQEEKSLLLHFHKEMQQFQFFITYNGVAFDYPFLKERFKKYNISWDHQEIDHFDILYHLRKCKSQLSLDNFKLKTVENFLGINRSDTINGKDSVELYKQYVLSKTPALEKTILLHNYEDIYYLAKVAGVFDHFPKVNYLLNNTFLTMRHNQHPINFSYHPYDICIKKNSLQVSGKTTRLTHLPKEVHYTPHYDFKWLPLDGSFQIVVPLQKTILPTKETFFYLNLKNLQYIFDLKTVEIETAEVFNQPFMVVDLCTPTGLMNVINILNALIKEVLNGK